MEKMKAVVYHKKGSPEKLIYEDVDKPVPAGNEILVKIHAVSLNAADYRSMQLRLIPRNKIFGADISGVVESTGEKVFTFQPGDEVIGSLVDYGFGGLAQYVAVPENALIKKPKEISFAEASTLPVAGITALQALRDKGNISKDDKVLIVGSAGGVGTFTVQLAKHFGAEVTAVCSTKNVEQSFALGADEVLDYTKENFTQKTKRYNIILAVNGSYPLLAYRKALETNGTYVMVGGSYLQLFKSLVFGWLLSFGGKKMKHLMAKELNSDLEILAELTARRIIKPVIERHYPLKKAAEAMNYLKQGHSSGKVVVDVV
ncbi:NAD(P)-dependent alcohol dehydrogenase [Mariniphaga sp.]|uniref:NAD(P)-dependent alcohol dehydrogenase n=1 Tax=Mariniphaga sp. TaxID=1954475 RepID=UPI003565DEAA